MSLFVYLFPNSSEKANPSRVIYSYQFVAKWAGKKIQLLEKREKKSRMKKEEKRKKGKGKRKGGRNEEKEKKRKRGKKERKSGIKEKKRGEKSKKKKVYLYEMTLKKGRLSSPFLT